MTFEGFPARTSFTSVPDIFINQLAPKMTQAELVLMLAAFNIIFNKKGYPRYATAQEFAAHSALDGRDTAALANSAVQHGLLLPLAAGSDTVYFLNNHEGRQAITKAGQGELKIQGTNAVITAPTTPPPPNIFALYEENIGLLTPIIAEELKDALATYPEEWIGEAIKEAVSLNKRNWRYIQRILERWVAEGKNSHGTHQPNIERDKFVRGRYGGLVQR